MSAGTLSPPRPPDCLTRSDLSRGIKGGTIIAEDVLTLDVHEEKLRDPDGYRPESCRCGSVRLHAHCFRERKLRDADPEITPLVVAIRLYHCLDCGAVYTILPAFIARLLWRSWKTVESAVKRKRPVPKTTLKRWLSRLASDAGQLFQLFTASVTGPVVDALLRARPATRKALVAAIAPEITSRLGAAFAPLAAWIHRLEAGLRLM